MSGATADTPSSAPRRGLRVRWWWWPIAMLTLLLAAAVAVRLNGSAQYARVQADLRARGLPTTAVELVAIAPPVDRGRQERLWKALQAAAGWSDWKCDTPASELQAATGNPAVDRTLAAGAADVAAIERILDEGPVQLSAFGWIERDPDALRAISLAKAAATRIPSLLTTRGCANWWATRAVLADDPLPALARLDQWQDGMRRPATLIDAMIAVAVGEIRDRACLRLATRGRLPPTVLARWLAEEPEQRRWSADGLASERCLFWEPASRLRLSEVWPMSSLASSLGSPSRFVGAATWWPMQFHDMAFATSEIAAAEAGLTGRTPPPIYQPPFGYRGVLSSIALPNLSESGITATTAAFAHRLRRIAGAIAAAYRAGAPLPDDVAALARMLPAGALDAHGPALPPVAYERLSPDRFRVGLDPHSPQPAGIPPGRIVSDIGKPADAKPYVEPRWGWSLEIDLDAILVPPPTPAPKLPKPKTP